MYTFVPSNIEHPISQVIAASNGHRPLSHSPFRPVTAIVERSSSPSFRHRVGINPLMDGVSTLKKSVRFEDGGSLGRTQAVLDRARTINTLNRRIIYPAQPMGVGIVNASPLRSSPRRNTSPGLLRPDRFASPMRSMDIRGGLSPA